MRPLHRCPAWCLAGALLLPAAASARPPRVDPGAVDRAVEAELKRQNVVGAAVAVIRGGEVVHARGYGLADLARGTPVTTRTVFDWAANSEPVMAVLAMRLVQADRLDLDAGVETYLPDLPSTLHGVTVRQLLCHQSGIPHDDDDRVVPNDPVALPAAELDPRAAVRRFSRSPLLFAPGTRTDYSSYGYVLLSAVVQEAGGAPIAEQLDRRVVKRLRLRSFQLDLPRDGGDGRRGDRRGGDQRDWAAAYRLVGRRHVPEWDAANYWKHGAGGYKSDMRDFAAFAAALTSGDLLDRQAARAMWTPQNLADGSRTVRGLGFVVGGRGRSLKVSHDGSQDGTKTRLVLYPNQGHGVVVMCNSAHADPGAITTAVDRALR